MIELVYKFNEKSTASFIFNVEHKQRKQSTVFPQLECTRSINFILLPRDDLNEVRVVIGSTLY